MKGYPSSISLNNEYVFVPMCKLLIDKKKRYNSIHTNNKIECITLGEFFYSEHPLFVLCEDVFWLKNDFRAQCGIPNLLLGWHTDTRVSREQGRTCSTFCPVCANV